MKTVKCVWCGEEQKDLQALVLHRARKHHRIGVRAKWDEDVVEDERIG